MSHIFSKRNPGGTFIRGYLVFYTKGQLLPWIQYGCCGESDPKTAYHVGKCSTSMSYGAKWIPGNLNNYYLAASRAFFTEWKGSFS